VSETAHKTVTVVGGGVAGMSTACALAEAGFVVRLVERRGYLGGRASSYRHPGVDEVIDNCQHVVFGCCTNVMDFYRRIGVAEKIQFTGEMTMIEPGGRRSVLGPSRLGPFTLPAPLHGLPRLMAARAFTWADKLALARAFGAVARGDANDANENLADWLQRHKQTHGAVERFWRLVIASALNAEIETISVPYAAMVIRGLFMDSVFGGAMGVSRVPLSELYAGVAEFLQSRGGELVLNTTIEGGEKDEETSQWILRTRAGGAGAGELRSDFVVVALPFEGMAKLLPGLPPVEGADVLASQIERHEHWPLCSVHLWFDREITELDHAVLLDREIHWLYNQARIQGRAFEGRATDEGHYIELVISADRAFAALTREAAIDQAMRELAEFFPAVKDAKLIKAALVKEVKATFGVPPGINAARPGAVSPWPGLFLAGDWVRTGWPSTMESAARSGHLAAESLCSAAGRSQRFLVPDLKPQGLMRLIRAGKRE
jgi:squalene-associated FAD-dependent desaturase